MSFVSRLWKARKDGVRSSDAGAERAIETRAPPAPGDLKHRLREEIAHGRFEEAKAVGQCSVQVWRELGGEFLVRDQRDLAVFCRRMAVEAEPDNLQVRLELIRDLLLAGRTDEANDSDLGQSILWRQLGGELRADGGAEIALYCRRRALELDPGNDQLRKELIQDALALDRDRLKSFASPADALALRVIAEEHLTQRSEVNFALECLRWAFEIAPEEHRIQEDLIGLLISTGQCDEARQIAESLDPEKLPKSFPRSRYKDFTAREKCMLVEVGRITLASPETIVELTRAIDYILENKIPGAFVECGVFQGGNAVLMLRCLLDAGVADRDVYLYDTFEGFPKPEEVDYEYSVGPALQTWQSFKKPGDNSEDRSDWLKYPIELVQQRVFALGYPRERIRIVKGLVEETIPAQAPGQIALLRLDTDFYRSTKHELDQLFPRLQRGGILVIDDYGALHGARVATDEYLKENGVVFFPARTDEHVRIGVKL